MRLSLAFGLGLTRPGSATAVLYPNDDFDMGGLAQVTVVHGMKPSHDLWHARGYDAQPTLPDQRYDMAVVRCTRSKLQTLDLIAQAAAVADVIVVDGQKTDGIDSHYKSLRKRLDVLGTVTKAHGRLFWFHAADLSDLRAPVQTVDGFETRAGVFSVDGIDPGSALLAAAIPNGMSGDVCDLGGGWGYLSKHVLAQSDVAKLDLVEADYTALTCARRNVTDTRANFHWADACDWAGAYDHVIMNPPFHTGRKGDPDLGKAFIATAARCLGGRGALWMVANRHLPYEETLNALFAEVVELPGNGRFKLFKASRPRK